MKTDVLEAILKARAEKQSVVRAVRLSDGQERLVRPQEDDQLFGTAAQLCLREDKAQRVEIDGSLWFIHPHNPPLRLMIVGAVHIAQPLAQMGRIADYEVTIIDPRSSFLRRESFSEQEVVEEWPDEALEALKPDTRSAIVTLTHDPKLDDPALIVALQSQAFYIGCLGSRRTHSARLHRLEKKGFSADKLARLHGPVGLPIGAQSPAEIAIAILADMTEVLRKTTS